MTAMADDPRERDDRLIMWLLAIAAAAILTFAYVLGKVHPPYTGDKAESHDVAKEWVDG